jgi:hypothetical protein
MQRPRFFGVCIPIAAILCYLHCASSPEKKPLLVLTARLAEENNLLNLVLRNGSECELTICKHNFYDAVACLDVRHYPDTSEFMTERVFGKNVPAIKQRIITLDDFCKLPTGQETRIPLDLRCIAAHCRLGDTVFIAAFFKNIDPSLCSKVLVVNYDKATQDYCKLLHVIPTLENNYWSGEVKTGYLPVKLCKYAPPKSKKKRGKSKVRVLRRSRTHPLNHQVF